MLQLGTRFPSQLPPSSGTRLRPLVPGIPLLVPGILLAQVSGLWH